METFTVNIVVRGERGTGKTMLTKLLTGGVFDVKYTPSKAGETERFCVPWAAGGFDDDFFHLFGIPPDFSVSFSAGEDVDLTLTAYTDTGKDRHHRGCVCTPSKMKGVLLQKKNEIVNQRLR